MITDALGDVTDMLTITAQTRRRCKFPDNNGSKITAQYRDLEWDSCAGRSSM